MIDPDEPPLPGAWYDRAAADAAVDFFPRHLRLTSGEWAGRPFTLERWQEHEIIRPLFGWKRADGTRLYRRVFVWVPRKNGKTELAAGVSLLALLGDAEMRAEVYAIAADKDQAKIVFEKAVAMVQWSERLSEHLECFKTSIFCPGLMASFKPLSGTPEGKHGLNMSGLIGDEIHEWRDGRLYTFVHQSSAARRQPIEFLISTAGARTGHGWETWQYCLKLRAGEIDDPETLVVIYAADPEDDWTDPAVWAKANPNLGVSVKREYLEAECRKARELPRLENDFKRYHLDLWTEQAVRWLPPDAWDACGHPTPDQVAALADLAAPQRPEPEPPHLRPRRTNYRWREFEDQLIGRYCTGGIDLSSTTDLTVLLWVFPPEEEGGMWMLLPRFFVPEVRIAERSRRDRVAYDLWREMGALVATPGNVVDYAWLKRQAFLDAERFKAGPIAIDRWNATQLTTELREEGLDAVLFGQGFASMSAPAKELEKLVLDHRIDHGGHPVLRWCAGNVAIERDAADNIKPSKAQSTERIDGIVAAIMGIGVALAQPGPTTSVYETRGLVVVGA